MADWQDSKEYMPEHDVIVEARVKFYHSENVEVHELVHVNADDHAWETADDNSELDEFSCHVVSWRYK